MPSLSRWRRWVVILAFANALVAAAATVPPRVVAVSARPAPGLPAGTSFATFTECVMNNIGEVAFVTELAEAQSQTTRTNQRAVFLDTGSSIQLVAAAGQQAPGTPTGVTFALLMNLVLNQRGQVAFTGVLQGPGVVFGTNQVGIFFGEPGHIQLVARSGDPAPDTDGIPYRVGLDHFALNNQGELAFSAGLGQSDTGIWAGPPGGIHLAVRTGGPAPVQPTNIQSLAWPEQPGLNDLGDITFAALLGETTPDSAAVFVGLPGSLNGVAWPGDPTPVPGLQWGNALGTPTLNNAGEVLLDTLVQDADLETSPETLWLSSVAGSRLLARTGDPAPGTGLFFQDFNAAAALGSSGDVTFVAHLQDITSGLSNPATDTAVYLSTAAGLRLLAWKGAPAVGMPVGVVFGDPARPATFAGLFVNEHGQVAFNNVVSGPGVVPDKSAAIWVTDTSAVLHLLIRQGDPLELGNGFTPIIRTLISGVALGGGPEDGRASPFNSVGQYSVIVTWNSSGSAPAGAAVVVLTAPTPLQLNLPQRIGNDLQLTFATDAGTTYLVQSTDHLQPPQWSVLTQVTGTGGIVSVSDSNAALLPHRFYRVQQLD